MIRAVLILCLTLILGGAAHAQMGGLAHVMAEDSALVDRGRGVELTLRLSHSVPYRIFTLGAPNRVVIDFRSVDWRGLPEGFHDTDNISRVITGQATQADWTRMVLELGQPMQITRAVMQTEDQEQGQGLLTLRMAPVDQAVFDATIAPPVTLAVPVAPIIPARPRDDPARRPLVVLDPGHGGIDPGAQRDGHDEADLVLVFAQELREALLRTGQFDVALTRSDDVFVPLPTRLSLARAAGADLFLSIHADALAEGDGQATGASVYTLSQTASDAAAAALAAYHDRADLLAGVDLGQADDGVADILMDMARRETDPRSAALAGSVVEGLRAADIALHARPHLQADFTVLRAPDFPSLLIEIGFMSSAQDLANILDPAWRARAQAGLVSGLLAWQGKDRALQALLRR